jgi:glutamate--cysteine ligase
LTTQRAAALFTDAQGLSVVDAREHVAHTALRPSTERRVGLELEAHLVDLDRPAARPSWARVQAVLADVPPMPAGSAVTVEPGGQIELSTPPLADAVAAVRGLLADVATLRTHLAGQRLGAAALGADPARPLRRVNPGTRYVAMEQHLDAVGCGAAGRAMMTATAALQVNLDAGPEQGWAERLDALHALVPVLVAASAASPYLAGRASGWQSMRREAWLGIDGARTGAMATGDPVTAWADYALGAPVMMVRDGDQTRPLTTRVSFAAWADGHPAFDRPPSVADLDYHLTTLFPPVRPRGYLEIRGLDALPDRWWPAVVALTTVLLDDPVATDRARDAAGSLAEERAARAGCADPAVRRVVLACLAIASERAPADLRADVDDLAALIESGRTVSDLLRRRIERVGPHRVLEEEAHA